MAQVSGIVKILPVRKSEGSNPSVVKSNLKFKVYVSESFLADF